MSLAIFITIVFIAILAAIFWGLHKELVLMQDKYLWVIVFSSTVAIASALVMFVV